MIRYSLSIAFGVSALAACASNQQAPSSQVAFMPAAQNFIKTAVTNGCDTPTVVTLQPSGGELTFPTCHGYTLRVRYRNLIPTVPVQITIEDGTKNYDKLPPTKFGGTNIFYYSECCPSADFKIANRPKYPPFAIFSAAESKKWKRSNNYCLASYDDRSEFEIARIASPRCHKSGLCMLRFPDHSWFTSLSSSFPQFDVVLILNGRYFCSS